MKNAKKSLLLCAASLVLCAALLVGTTFAWFTDSVTNKNNSIKAGSLMIDAYAYATGTDGVEYEIPGINAAGKVQFEAKAQDLKQDSSPIIEEDFWEPGVSSAKLLQVVNRGTLAAKLRLQFDVTDGGLEDALWFDFIRVEADGSVSGDFTKRPMSTLQQTADTVTGMVLEGGQSVQFVLVYGMDENASSQYMGKDFSVDVTILATQAAVEMDGFGNTDYDAAAPLDFVPVSTEAGLQQAIAEGKSIVLTEDIALTQAITTNGSLVIQGNGNTLDLSGAAGNSLLVNRAQNAVIQLTDVNLVTDQYNNSAIALANSDGVSIVLDGCQLTGFKYGIWVANGNTNLDSIVIKNTDLSAWGTAYFYNDNCHITFENCVLEGTNVHSGYSNSFSTVVIQGPTFSGTNATGHDNVVTFSHCTLKAFNEPNAEPQHILSLQYGACNNTVYFNDCVIEQNTSGSIVHMDEDAAGNHVFVDGREIQANTNQIEFID